MIVAALKPVSGGGTSFQDVPCAMHVAYSLQSEALG